MRTDPPRPRRFPPSTRAGNSALPPPPPEGAPPSTTREGKRLAVSAPSAPRSASGWRRSSGALPPPIIFRHADCYRVVSVFMFRFAFRSAGRALITFERRNLLQNSACLVFISLLRVFGRARSALPARRSPSPMPAYGGRALGAAAVAPPLGAGLPFIPSPYSQAAFGSSSHSVSGFARVPRFAPAASGER